MEIKLSATAAGKVRDKRSLNRREPRRVRREVLVNTLNHINFQDGSITLNFKDPAGGPSLSLPAKPKPCLDSQLECLWAEGAAPERELADYQFENFFLTDGLHQIMVDADLLEIGTEGVRFALPQTSYDVSSRTVKRHPCHDVSARLGQGEILLQGRLSSFSADSFSVVVDTESFSGPSPFVPEDEVNVTLIRDSLVVYSGNCELIRQTWGRRARIALRPGVTRIQRYRPKEVRSDREVLSPLPSIIFRHPLTGRTVNLPTLDISGVGFSVEEDRDRALLLPGMIIDDLSIEFMEDFVIRCRAQVLYRNAHQEESLKCGFAVLNMDVRDHLRLFSYLQRNRDKNSYIGTTNVDLDALWDFFRPGFIYPRKYSILEKQKEEFKNLYHHLYTGNPEVARP